MSFDDSHELSRIVMVQDTSAYLRRSNSILKAGAQTRRKWRLAEEAQQELVGTENSHRGDKFEAESIFD
jgi:hypothetical protein